MYGDWFYQWTTYTSLAGKYRLPTRLTAFCLLFENNKTDVKAIGWPLGPKAKSRLINKNDHVSSLVIAILSPCRDIRFITQILWIVSMFSFLAVALVGKPSSIHAPFIPSCPIGSDVGLLSVKLNSSNCCSLKRFSISPLGQYLWV